jgi:cytochrome c peroxidase
MKFTIFQACVFSLALTGAMAQTGILDLTQLENYANQPRPTYILRDNTPQGPNPPANPITNLGATLGRVMFYDKRLSRNSTISCSTCHQQSVAFSDNTAASTGVAGTTGRHSMRLINSRFSAERRFFWDERAISLEDQTTRPIQDHAEMGFSGTEGDPVFSDLITRLSAIEEYRVLFAAVYGDATITEPRVQRALAQFVRSIQSFDSKYDIGRAQVANNNDPFPNFTQAENNGKALFATPPNQGGAGCAGCHRPPEFDIDPNSLNNGIIGKLGGGTDLTNTRSPSLRDLLNPLGQLNGPMMHDGSLTTLAAMINHYVAPPTNSTIDPRLNRPPLNLNQTRRDELIAFLRTLTGSAVYTAAKWSSPFNAAGQLTLIVLPATAARLQPNAGASNAVFTATAVPGLSYRVESSTNLVQWDTVTTVTANTTGLLEHAVNVGSTPTFFRFTYTPPAS